MMVSLMICYSKINDPCPEKTAKPHRTNTGYLTIALGRM